MKTWKCRNGHVIVTMHKIRKMLLRSPRPAKVARSLHRASCPEKEMKLMTAFMAIW